MKNNEDLRIKKTKMNLKKTLIILLGKKSFEEIKVSEICNNSYINRSTFYAHYKDKYELFNDTIESLKNDLTKSLSENNDIHNAIDYIMKLLEIYLNYMEKNKEIYLPIINHNKNGIIMDMVENTLEKDLALKLSKDYNIFKLNIPIEILIKFYIGAIFNTSIEWLNNTNKYTKDDIQKYLKIIISNGISH